MNVSDMMTAHPVTISQESTLREALEIMEAQHCRHLPVIGSEGHMVGILSDRDCRTALNSPYILRSWWQDDELARTLKVRTIMSTAPIIVEPNMPAEEAARLMLNHRISALPVMRSETLVGIVTTSDILAAFMHLQQHAQVKKDL